MEGQSLADYLDATARTGKLPSPTEIVHLLIPIATALDSAHQRGELHGALTPSVILLDTRRATPSSPGEPTFSKFGMHQKLDLRLLSLNDASYIAPEVAQGQAGTTRSDLYSLAVILYELCTGAAPFQGETASDILMQHIHSAPIPPVLINPHIRPAVTAVLMRGLARDEAARFSSATALVTAAAKAMNISVPERTSRPDTAPTVITPPPGSDINDPNTPTYLMSPPAFREMPPSQSGSPPPTSSRPPMVPSITPVLPPTSTGSSPQIQPSMNATPVPPQAAGPQPIGSMSGPMPVTPPASGPQPIGSTSGPIPVIPVTQQASGPHPVVSTSGPMPVTPPASGPQPMGPMSGPMPVIPVTQQASGPHPVVSTSGPMPVTPPASGPQPILSTSGPMPVTPLVPPPSRPTQRPLASFFAYATSTRERRISVLAALALLLIAVLLGSVVLLYLAFTPPPSSSPIVGHAFFLSSGLISKQSNQGTTDGLRISLQNIGNPQSGKRYYGWLTSSGTELPVALGPLSVDHGQITTTYTDPNHNNLLAHYGHFLITEEDANQQPTNPSLDVEHDWRYYATFSAVPSQTDPNRFSVLDHLRHLLAQDPKLEKVGLQGGLGVWLFRNTTKILEAAGSARDTRKACAEGVTAGCDTGLILRQVARILDYLDGAKYVGRENIPSSIQGDQLLIDPNVAQVALLEFDTVNQQPPGYLEHIGRHLRDLTRAPGVTTDQRTLANRINQDINNVQGWLDAVHADASKLIQMSPDDLVQSGALTTLNDLFTQANSAFVGQIDPNTGIAKEGVVQIYYNIQALATFDVASCIVNNGQSSCA